MLRQTETEGTGNERPDLTDGRGGMGGMGVRRSLKGTEGMSNFSM